MDVTFKAGTCVEGDWRHPVAIRAIGEGPLKPVLPSFPLTWLYSKAKIGRLHCHQKDRARQRETILVSFPSS